MCLFCDGIVVVFCELDVVEIGFFFVYNDVGDKNRENGKMNFFLFG